MNSNDFDYGVRESRTFATTGSLKLLFNEFDVQWVTLLNPTLEPADCFRVTQGLFGSLEIHPPKPKPALRRSKTASENVKQSIEIVSPVESGNYTCRNFIPKAAQAIEPSTVDFNETFCQLS